MSKCLETLTHKAIDLTLAMAKLEMEILKLTWKTSLDSSMAARSIIKVLLDQSLSFLSQLE